MLRDEQDFKLAATLQWANFTRIYHTMGELSQLLRKTVHGRQLQTGVCLASSPVYFLTLRKAKKQTKLETR